MKKLIFYLILILGLTSFKPIGSATAYLTCKSESGRTTFKAEIQDIDGGLEKAELTIDGVQLKFTGVKTQTSFSIQRMVFIQSQLKVSRVKISQNISF